MKVRSYSVWLLALPLALLLTACPPVEPTPQGPLEPLSVGIDIRGGNNDHTDFESRIDLTLDGTDLQLSGEIDRVDVPPTRLMIREGNVWEHYLTPGREVAQYPLEGEFEDTIDLTGSLTLTEEDAGMLRLGLFYVDVDTSYTALGQIVTTEEQRKEGGSVEIVLVGLPPNDAVEVNLISAFPHVNRGPLDWFEMPGGVFTDLYFGEYEVVPPVYDSGSGFVTGVPSVTTVTVDDSSSPVVTIVFTGVE